MDFIPFDFIRPKEEILPRTILNTTLQDITNSDLLSSPISSYDIRVDSDDSHKLHIKHHQPYPLHYKNIKHEVEMLRDETRKLRINYANTRHDLAKLRHDHALLSYNFQQLRNVWDAHRQEQEADKEKMVDWETRSRIAQGLNDKWAPLVTMDFNHLKANGFNYLPHILSVWAVWKRYDPAPRFLDKINQKDVNQMNRRAELLDSKGLGIVVDRVWDSITTTDRNTMVMMYLTIRSHPRTSIAHPSPTSDEAWRVIEDDPNLSTEEKDVAHGIIETAVDKNGDPLF